MRGAYAAAVAVDHVVRQGHRAVEVGARRDGVGAVAVVDDAAVAGGEAGDAEHLAVGGDVHIAEAGQQVGRADGVGGVLGAGCQHGCGRAGGRVVDRCDIQ